MTPTQRRLWEALSDGTPRPFRYLQDLLNDNLSSTALKAHICMLRPQLPNGLSIVSYAADGILHYQLVRPVNRSRE